MPEDWWSYVIRVGGGRSLKDMAVAADLDASQISRWKTGASRPRAENAIRLARKLGAAPLEALLAAGFLTSAEAGAAVTVRMGLFARQTT